MDDIAFIAPAHDHFTAVLVQGGTIVEIDGDAVREIMISQSQT